MRKDRKQMSISGYYEQIPFEDASFPLRINYDCLLSPEQTLTNHEFSWHEQMEILWFHKGGAIVHCGDNAYTTQDGDIIVINPYEIHFVAYLAGSPEYTCIMIDASLYSNARQSGCETRYLGYISKKQVFFENQISNDAEAIRFIQDLCREFEKKQFAYELSIKSHLYGFLTCLFRRHIRNEMTFRELIHNIDRYDRLKPALEYMRDNLSEQISLETLSRICSVNPSHFCRLFQKIMKKTPVQYLTDIRLNQAAYLLKNSDKSISQIACDVGISDAGYFGRKFKEHFGITPSQMKKRT